MDTFNTNDIDRENDISDLGIKVLDSQKFIFNKNYSSRIQFHPFTYFYFLINGEGKLSIENESIDVRQNDLIIINSNIGHTMYNDGNFENCEVIGFGVESISISSVDKKKNSVNPTNFFHSSLTEESKALSTFESIFDEYNSKDLFSRSMANSLASIFIINILRANEDKLAIQHDRKINHQIDYVKSYIDNNYAEDIKLEQLSTMAYMNKFHLISEFKQAYRVTPIEYLILKRIEISKNLLISTNHSMEEISTIVGFNSQSYFNQVFKKKTMQTPSQFRKKHRL